jgi:hypothetical protein
MSDNKLPLAYRDSCAHLAIPLNKCRFENFYLPWRCMVSFWHREGIERALESDWGDARAQDRSW